ncbi:MAG TPA: CBS domain-containing protein [Sedimentisphaerales bacterium]|nr:CBS domain-containing protein [Sedimentisphaerales bacterium]
MQRKEDKQFRLIDLLDDLFAGRDVFFKSVCLVKDMMTECVKALTLDDTIEMCIKFMKEHHVRHIPVVDNPTGEDEQQTFVGIVSQRDVFRQISPYLGKVGEADSDSEALKQPLVRFVTRDPKSVSPETSIQEMISIMVDNRINMMPVLVDRDIVGIVTSTDILKLFIRLDTIRQLCSKTGKTDERKRFVDLLSGNSDKVMPAFSTVLRVVEDVMTEQVVYLEEQESLAKAMEVMQKGKFRHVPIVDEQKKLVGVISDRDVLRYLPYLRPGAESFHNRLFDVAPNNAATQQSLHQIMTRDVTCVLPSCDFYTAVKMLYEMNISCLPVTDDDKKLVGIVTVTDVMRGLLAAYSFFEKAAVT